MSNPIEQYQYLIELLAPNAHDHNFFELVVEQTHNCSDDVRFLLIMEVKRLAQPCIKVIDLRTLVDDDCDIVLHEGIKHYLSAEAQELFTHLLERFKHYTTGVYEGVLDYYEKQRDIDLGSNLDKPSETAFSPSTYITPVNSILEYPSRSEERMLVDIEVRLFLSSSVLVCATALDISRQGLRINLENETELTLIKGYRPVQIVFTGLGAESKLKSLPVAYRVCGISRRHEKADIHLSREWGDGPKAFNDFLHDLFITNKNREAIDAKNTQMAIECKIYEQAFSTSSQGLSLFINTRNLLEPFVEYACYNDFSLEIFDYWQDENQQQVIGYLFSKHRLQRLLIESDTERCMIVYTFNHVNNGKVYFYSATEQELDNAPELKNVFLSYASRKASWKVYKLVCHQIDSGEAFLPSSLPNGISQFINQTNRKPAPKLASKLAPLSHMLTLSDITPTLDEQCYQQRGLAKDKIKLLAFFGHAKNRPPTPIEMFKFAWFDKRRERRYKLRTDLEILYNQQEFLAVSEDVSVHGLRVELERTMVSKIDDYIYVSFPRLQEMTTEYDLQALPYKVISISDDGYILHLKAAEKEESDIAKAFFKMLIDKNRDKLQVLPSDHALPGFRQALRVLQAKYTPQVCVFTHQQKDLHYPVNVIINLQKSRDFPYFAHKMPSQFFNVNALFSVSKIQNIQHIGKAINLARKQNTATNHEIYLWYDASAPHSDDALQYLWEHELTSYAAKYKFIRKALNNGEFFALRISCTAKQTPSTSLYDEELKYLRKAAPKSAKSLEALAWGFSGHVFLTDISAEVLLRYRLFQAEYHS